jgi:hypothetical protein
MKKLFQMVKAKLQKGFSFMTPISWMGVFAFAVGFFVGSEGEWAGTLFFPIFWIVGIYITNSILDMYKK